MEEIAEQVQTVEAAAHKNAAVLAPPTEEQIKHALAIAHKNRRMSGPAIFRKCNGAFKAGVRAKRMDWSRVSTVYCDALADEFFFDGYDGVVWEDAVKRLIG